MSTDKVCSRCGKPIDECGVLDDAYQFDLAEPLTPQPVFCVVTKSGSTVFESSDPESVKESLERCLGLGIDAQIVPKNKEFGG